MKKARPASKKFLKALAEAREEDTKKSPEDRFLDARGAPATVRMFGVELKRKLHTTQAGDRALYEGGPPDARMSIWQNGFGRWFASVTFGVHTVTPDISSASIPAAIRDLRGHLLNLQLDLDRLLWKKAKPKK